MATLQKIRNHGVFLAIIIGVALLAFVIGDLLKSSSTMFQQSKQSVLTVDGETVDIIEFQEAVEQLKQIYKIELGRSDFNEKELSQIRNSVWESLVNEKLIQIEAEKIGLTVGTEELKEKLIGKDIHPLIMQRSAFTDPKTGKFSRSYLVQFYNSIFGEKTSNQDDSQLQDAKSYWLFWENEVRKSILQEKFVALLGKSIGANSVESKFNFNARNESADVNYVFQPYFSISDSTIQVNNKEIKEKYNKDKEIYKQDANRSIKYVSFKVEPLKEDFDEAAKWITKTEQEFKTTDDIIGLVNQESDKSYNKENFSKENVPANLKEFAFSNSTGAIYGPTFENNTYTMAKIMESGIMESDSAKLRHIALTPNDDKKADSLINVLRAGANFGEIARKNSLVPQTASKGGEIGWVTRKGLEKELTEKVFSKGIKEIFKVSNSQGVQIFQVLERAARKPKVKLAILERKITPSNASYSKIYNDAKQFAVNGNNADKFEKTAQEKGYIVRQATRLSANAPSVQAVPQSRQIVKWAFENKTGTVSDVFDCDRQEFVVACVDQINEEGYASLESVKQQIKSMLVKDKKAEKLIAQIAEKQKNNATLESLATAMNTEVKTATGVNFVSYQFGESGPEPYIIGTTTLLEANKISKPLKGNTGVYVVQTTSKSKEATPYNKKLEISQLNSRTTQSVPFQIIQKLKEKYKVEDNRSRFY